MSVRVNPILISDKPCGETKFPVWAMISIKYRKQKIYRDFFVKTDIKCTQEQFYIFGRPTRSVTNSGLKNEIIIFSKIKWIIERDIKKATPESVIDDLTLIDGNNDIAEEYKRYLKNLSKEDAAWERRDELRRNREELLRKKRLQEFEKKAAEEKQIIIQSKLKNKQPDYVYLMYNKKTGYYKIGKSNNPSYRERTLQSQEPDINLLCKSIGGVRLEKKLHFIFKDKRIRGEWFDLNENDIIEFKKLLIA